MGQPIKLVKGKEKMTVYGQAQARVHIAQGWQLEAVAAQVEADKVIQKVVEEVKGEDVLAMEMLTIVEKPKSAARKPRAKK